MSSDEVLRFEIDGPIFRITIDRPEHLNSINFKVYEALEQALMAFAASDARIAVVLGKGSKAFIAGADISDYIEPDSDAYMRLIEHGHRIMWRMRQTPKPIVAAVQGYALGGGLEIALACDLIVASERSRFGLPEASLGLVPGGGGTQRLTRLVGRLRANDLMMRARIINAKEAFDMGFVNLIVPDESFTANVQEYLMEIASKSTQVLSSIKHLTGLLDGPDFWERMQVEAQHSVDAFLSPNGREGVRAFVEKRTPNFHAG